MARPISAEAKEDLKEMDLLPIYMRKGENTVNPRNGGTICPILHTSQNVCRPPKNTVPSLPICPVVETPGE